MRSTPVCAFVPVKWPLTVTVCPLKLMTRLPLLVPVLLSCALRPVSAVPAAWITMRSAVPPLVALTGSLMVSFPSARPKT